MHVENPRRLLAALLVLVLALTLIFAALAYLLRGGSEPGPAAVPSAVSVALSTSIRQPRVLITTQQHGQPTVTQLVDRPAGVYATYSDGRLASLVVGQTSYTHDAAGCYDRGAGVSASASSVSPLILPGSQAVSYSYPRAGVIDWRVSSKSPAPHGELFADPRTHLISAAVIVGESPSPESITVNYAPSIQDPGAPTDICTA